MSLNTLLEQYEQALRGRKRRPRGIERYKHSLRRFFRHLGDNAELHYITPSLPATLTKQERNMTTATIPFRAILSTGQPILIGLEVAEEGQVSIGTLVQETGIRAEIWQMLARQGHISYSMRINDTPELVNQSEAQALAARLTAARQAVAGQGITASDAAEKYGFDRVSIHNWHKNGWIKSIGTGVYNAVLFDEGDIAMARALADIQGQIAGRAVFPAKPRPGRPRKK